MTLWQWVIVICIPLLTAEHVGLSIWHHFFKFRDEVGAMKSRDKEWQDIFTTIKDAYEVTTRTLVTTLKGMQKLSGDNDPSPEGKPGREETVIQKTDPMLEFVRNLAAPEELSEKHWPQGPTIDFYKNWRKTTKDRAEKILKWMSHGG